MDEFELIKNYFQKISKNNPSAKKLNDDVFFDKKNNLVISVDTYNEGVHFPNFKYPNLVIKKVIRSSISDLIAKGVKPEYYFISGSGNKNQFTKKNLRLISKSLNQEQKKYNIKLSGGDTTNSNKVSFSITTIGFSKNIIERNKARLNDDIYVTGNIGDSFLKFYPSRQSFESDYIKMINNVLSFNLPTTLCTIYHPCYSHLEKERVSGHMEYGVNSETIQKMAMTALPIFNDIIFQEAVNFNIPVIYLRLIFNDKSDYANPIEPSAIGGLKMEKVIKGVVYEHDFLSNTTIVYK